VKLQKLKNASFDELRVRAAQRIAAFSERRGWSPLVKLPTDEAFANLLTLDQTTATEHLVEHFRSRTEPSFFTSFQELETTAAAFKSRWPATVQQLIDKADRICAGRFDLLGYKNLNFGDPIDWQFEPLTGKRIPLLHWSKLDYLDADVAGDKKIIWELNRHQYFVTLGQAYCLTGNKRYADLFAAHLNAWMDANPPKLGINWASSLEVAFRSMSWLWALHFFKSSSSISNDLFKRAWKFLYLSARHLESYLSTYFSPNTHLTGEALGLFFIGTLLPEFKEARRWRDLGAEILIEQLPIHVQPDGVYFEQSSYYHRYTTDFYLHFLLLARANNFQLPSEVERSLVLLLDHLMYLTRPDGTTPLFGDDDGGRLAMLDVRASNDFRGTLAVGAVAFDRADYRFVAAEAAEELVWIMGADGVAKFDLIVPKQPAKTSVAFPNGGYFVMRDGWTRDANYLLFDCGPHGSLACGHAHADALAIDVAANGHTVLVDPGTCTYTGSKDLRDWFRGSAAHNTVTVDGESSSAPNGPFSWQSIAQCSLENWVSSDRFDFISARHDGFSRLPDPVTVMREILFLKGDYWIIRDLVVATREHRVDISFHFDSEPGVADALEILCLGNGGKVEEEAFVSHCYGQREAAQTLKFSATLDGGGEIVTFLLPRRGEAQWSVKEIEAPDDREFAGRVFEVRGANTRDTVMIPTSGAWSWTRAIDGVVSERLCAALTE
jgi:Heparinase II/III-like protein/Heparinase II/III N-terminus